MTQPSHMMGPGEEIQSFTRTPAYFTWEPRSPGSLGYEDGSTKRNLSFQISSLAQDVITWWESEFLDEKALLEEEGRFL